MPLPFHRILRESRPPCCERQLEWSRFATGPPAASRSAGCDSPRSANAACTRMMSSSLTSRVISRTASIALGSGIRPSAMMICVRTLSGSLGFETDRVGRARQPDWRRSRVPPPPRHAPFRRGPPSASGRPAVRRPQRRGRRWRLPARMDLHHHGRLWSSG